MTINRRKSWKDDVFKLQPMLKAGLSDADIAIALGRTQIGVRRKIEDERKEGRLLDVPYRASSKNSQTVREHNNPGSYVSEENILGTPATVWDGFLDVKIPDFICACDWHIPYINTETLYSMLKTARYLNIKNLIIPGDLFSMEIFSFFKKNPTFTPGLADELKSGRNLFIMLFQWFKEIYVITGNHEERYWNLLDGRDDIFKVIAFLTENTYKPDGIEFHISPYRYMHVDVGDKYKFKICHQKNYSKNCLSVPRELSSKHSDKHIICSHTHAMGVGFAKDGERLIAEAGMMTHNKYFDYVMKNVTTHGAWNPGFLVYKDGRLLPMADRLGIFIDDKKILDK